jgi:hypothetical protein
MQWFPWSMYCPSGKESICLSGKDQVLSWSLLAEGSQLKTLFIAYLLGRLIAAKLLNPIHLNELTHFNLRYCSTYFQFKEATFWHIHSVWLVSNNLDDDVIATNHSKTHWLFMLLLGNGHLECFS